jgi:hypothetical protein
VKDAKLFSIFQIKNTEYAASTPKQHKENRLKPEKNGYIFENQQRNGYILGRSNGDLI